MSDSAVGGLRKRLPEPATVLVAGTAGVAGVAGSYAVAGFTPAFVVGPIAGEMARRLPAAIITFAIVVLGDLGDQLNVLTAALVAVGLLAAVSFVAIELARRLEAPPLVVLLSVGGGIGVTLSVTAAPLPSAVAGLCMGLVTGTAELGSGRLGAGVSQERRRVLGGAAAALTLSVSGALLGRRGGIRGSESETPLDVSPAVAGEVNDLLEEAERKSMGVDGIEPLVSEDFYDVDINATDPEVEETEWSLDVTGAVGEEVTYDYEDIRSMEPENRFVSLRCVGESLNGMKLDNALWTGVPVMELLEPSAPAEECCVLLQAADGYYQSFPLEALERGFLAYGMNGSVLPRGHGYPARVLIPGHWGEINVKWVTEIEVIEEETDGYWEERGWHGTGPVETVAKLHSVEHVEGGQTEVAGHAYAGTRGIERVEVSTDGGATWSEATLSEPLPGDDVWRQYRYRYDTPAGEHEVVVRATDGTGTVQPREESKAYPSGPTGWVSRIVNP